MGSLAKSKSEARRLISQGGISIDGVATKDVDAIISRERLAEGVIIRKGKKVYHKFCID